MISYNNPIVKLLETLGNMMIVSLYWIICSLPIITIVPSSAALYHTCVKVIFGEGKGKGITRHYFKHFVSSLKQGIVLSLIVLLATFFVVVGLNTGLQIYKLNTFGAFYMVLGVVISLIVYPAVFYIPIVQSRFEGDIMTILRIALYFASSSIFRNIGLALLFLLMCLAVYIFPLFLLVVPALYMDLVRPYMEKRLHAFIEINNLIEEETEEFEEEIDVEIESVSDFENSLSQNRKSSKK